jgi:hypothetical protein
MSPQEHFKAFQQAVKKDWEDGEIRDLEGHVISHCIQLINELDGYTAQDIAYPGFNQKRVLTMRQRSSLLMKIGCILARMRISGNHWDPFLRSVHTELLQTGLIQEIKYPEMV